MESSRDPGFFGPWLRFVGPFQSIFPPRTVESVSRSSSMAFAVFETERARDQVNRTAKKNTTGKNETQKTPLKWIYLYIYMCTYIYIYIFIYIWIYRGETLGQTLQNL